MSCAALRNISRQLQSTQVSHSKEGFAPLLLACSKGYDQVVSLLLTINEIDVNLGVTINGQKFTPLSVCEGLGHAHIAQQLRDHKVIPGSQD